MKNTAFYLGLGSLLTHELDAMTNHEWRILPLLRALPDDTARVVFVAAHVPLFALVIALIASPHPALRVRSRFVVAGFLLVHGIAHAAYIGHASYEFSSMLSNILIFGGAAFGAMYLFLELRAPDADNGSY